MPLPSQPANLEAHWDHLDREAEKELRDRFPILTNPPRYRSSAAETTPYRLYRHILSPDLIARNDCSITFLSLTGSAHTVTYAELSALWAVAWMGGLYAPRNASIDVDGSRAQVKNELERKVALVNAFLQYR